MNYIHIFNVLSRNPNIISIYVLEMLYMSYILILDNTPNS